MSLEDLIVLNERIDELEKQLEEAEEALRFYGDVMNYTDVGMLNLRTCITGDSSVGGKRAREYFKNKGINNVSK